MNLTHATVSGSGAVNGVAYVGPREVPEARLPPSLQRTQLVAFGHLVAAIGVALLASQLAWQTWQPWRTTQAFELFALALLAYAASALISKRLARFPRHGELGAVALGSLVVYAAFAACLAAAGLRQWTFLAASCVASLVCQVAVLGTRTQRPLRLGYLRGLRPSEALRPVPNSNIIPLNSRSASEVDAVLVDRSAPLHPRWASFLDGCERAGVPVYDDAVAIEELTGRIDPRWLARGAPPTPVSRWASCKHAADVLLVLGTSPLWGPIAALTALAVRLDSRGPIFFWQERVGAGGRSFRMLKFRSMRSDSEMQGARFAAKQDDRITRVGKIIRKLRLDEVPQFWNVLLGQMSLIGPRPEQAAFVRRFEAELPGYAQRHRLKPGITGWAQVSHGYAADADETKVKLEFDLYYVKNCSPWLDMLIVVRTVATMLTGFGAR